MKPQHKLRCIAFAVATPALFFSTLLDLGYPILSPEVILISLAAAVLGAAFGILFGSVSSLFIMGYTLVMYAFLDANVLGPRDLTALECAGLIAGIAGLLFLWEKHVLPIASVFAFAFSAGAIFETNTLESSRSADAALDQSTAFSPGDHKILHILLDEIGSPVALAPTLTADHPMALFVSDLVADGFHVSTNIDTMGTITTQSMGRLVQFKDDPNNINEDPADETFSYAVKSNLFHKRLIEAGYNVSILQTDYLDFCTEEVRISCQTYPANGNLRDFSDQTISTRLKMAGLALHQNFSFGERSVVTVYRYVAGFAHALERVERINFGGFAGPVTSRRFLEDLPNRVRAMEGGDVVFAHLLLPHFPYILDQNCELIPIGQWGYSKEFDGDQRLRPEPFQTYWDQLACTMALLAPTLEAANEHDNITVIVHGDHGPRIVWDQGEPSPSYMSRSIFAIKQENRPSGQTDELISLIDAFTAVFDAIESR